ncbi:MAG: hypothetical protein IKK92_06870 [Prevotella sp.]|nr:hypothetical protein [Prevotella sp.]
MRKFTFKSLLIAAALCLGTSAWAQTTYYSQDYEAADATADWTTGTGGRYTPVLLTENENTYLSVNQGERNNNGTTLTSTSLVDKVAAGTDFTMIFDMKISSSTKDYPTSFVVNDAENSSAILSIVATGTWATSWKVNDNITVTLDGTNKGNSTQTIADVPWYTFKLTRNGEYTYLTITATSSETVVLERTLITTLSSTGGLGNMIFKSSRYLANFAIDNIVVRSIEDGDVPEAVATTYTIKYVDVNGMDIIDPVVENTLAGEDVTAPITPIYDANGVKYIYESGTNTIEAKEDATKNVITLVFREAATYSYTIKSNLGSTIAYGSNFEGETITYGYPQYQVSDGTLYSTSVNNKEWRKSFVLTEDNQEMTVNYDATSIVGVVYHVENENIEGVNVLTANNANIRCSNAAAAWSSSDVVLTTLDKGTYKLVAQVFSPQSSGGNQTFKVGGVTINFITGNSNTTVCESEFMVTDNEDLVWSAGGGNRNGIDFVYVVKLSDELSPVTTTITDAGYATFSSAYAVDFSKAEGLAAYTAKVNDDKQTITLTKIADGIVPANTGVVLKGAAGEYTGTITTTDATVDNDLIANNAEITSDGNIYVLNKVGDNVGFYPLASGKTLAAGKAYLQLNSGAKGYTFVWNDGETTGIEENYEFGTMNSDAATFDLSGRKVANPAKGLYIKNGKKFIVK